ncbi:MAG: sugar transferase [Ignavibacteriales bacterium]|nr:sugar transferase [Ignavibacteriales bacterium]
MRLSFYEHIKRLIDLFISLVLILFTLPLQLILYFSIAITLRGNPLFIQERGVTLTNKRFRIIKFRTIAANHKKKPYEEFHEKKNHEDINAFGKFLRWSGLDELPQLYNVVSGKMSLIGPRPLMIDDLNHLKENHIDFYKQREKIKSLPGITGYWQINRKKDLSANKLIELDSYYEANKSFTLDAKILFRTAVIMFTFSNNRH